MKGGIYLIFSFLAVSTRTKGCHPGEMTPAYETCRQQYGYSKPWFCSTGNLLCMPIG